MKVLKIWLPLLFFSTSAFAVTNIGVIPLVFPSDMKDVIVYESGSENSVIENKTVINAAILQLNQLNTKLVKKNKATPTIDLVNAAPQIKIMEEFNPNFLKDLATMDIDSSSDTTDVESTVKNTETNPVKFFLVGYVSQIKCNLVRQKIMTSPEISFLYNLDITIKYRLVNAQTLKPVLDFTAIGHAGVASLLPPNNQVLVAINSDEIAENAVSSIASNVLHSLLINGIDKL